MALTTNAESLSEDQFLTREQIEAISGLEEAFIEGRGKYISTAPVEKVLHAFICYALSECVCAEEGR
jgi:hypothetical protein